MKTFIKWLTNVMKTEEIRKDAHTYSVLADRKKVRD